MGGSSIREIAGFPVILKRETELVLTAGVAGGESVCQLGAGKIWRWKTGECCGMVDESYFLNRAGDRKDPGTRKPAGQIPLCQNMYKI